jgi:hypothetical protein
MPKEVRGGIVYRNDQSEKLAAEVDHIDFPTVGSHETVPAGADGTLYLKNPPPQIGHYDRGDILYYKDSNRHNDSTFEVRENVGPTKYKIRVR